MSRRAVWRRGERRADTTLGLARGLGWFSLGLGLAQLLAPHAVSRNLGLRGQEKLIAGHGARGVATGIGILAARDPTPWIWGRVAGDALDIGTLVGGVAMGNGRERGNAGLAIAAMAGMTLLDVLCGRALAARKTKERTRLAWDYSSRRGMPQPAEAMRGAARDFKVPRDFRIPEAMRPWGSTG